MGYGTPWSRAIGDPTLELALWVPQQNGWVDEQGRDVRLPEGPDRAVTLVGDQLAAIIHDPVLLDQPALLEAAGSAARFAFENERLQAELRAQLAELRASRARIVRAGDEERRRLERDLHDGAQQRLLALGMALQLAAVAASPTRQGGGCSRSPGGAAGGAGRAARARSGIHPAVLTDQGLGTAIRTLAERAPVPVEVGACRRAAARARGDGRLLRGRRVAGQRRQVRPSEQGPDRRRTRGRALVRIAVDDDGVGGANAV